MAKRREQDVVVDGVTLRVRGTGFGNVSVLSPVEGTIEIHQAGGELVGADFVPKEPGSVLPVSPDDLVNALRELNG